MCFNWVIHKLWKKQLEKSGKKIKQQHLGKSSISDTSFDQNLHFCFFIIWSVCQTPSTHIHTKTHTQTNTHRHLARKSNKHYRNFIDCLTSKMKCYSTTSKIPLKQKPAFICCIEYLVPVVISYFLITSFATSIVFAQEIALCCFLKWDCGKMIPYTKELS